MQQRRFFPLSRDYPALNAGSLHGGTMGEVGELLSQPPHPPPPPPPTRLEGYLYGRILEVAEKMHHPQ